MPSSSMIESQIRSIDTSLTVAQQQLAQANKEGDTTRVAELNAYIGELNTNLEVAKNNLAEAQANEPPAEPAPPAQQPDGRDTPSTPESKAAEVEQATDSTETAPPKVNQEPDKPPVPSAVTTSSSSSPKAPNEDSYQEINTGNNGVVIFDGAAGLQNPITPSPNILDQYASYSYIISWYILTAEQYNKLSSTAKLDTSAWSLLMQSGGASAQEQTTQVSNTGTSSVLEDAGKFGMSVTSLSGGYPRNNVTSTPGRNKYFSNDYYIDNLIIKAAFTDRFVTNASELTFTVQEPNGITLIQNLGKAVVDCNKDPKANLKNTQYALVIRFYGWDQNGNLITKIKQAPGSPAQVPNDYNATVVKYFPFQLHDLTFKVAGRGIEYVITASPGPFKYALGQALGTVPEQLQLTGTTVGDILNGRVIEKTTPVGDGRESSNSPPPEKNKQTNIALNSMNEDGTYVGLTGPSATPMFDG